MTAQAGTAGEAAARIADLESRIADLRARLPRHSVPAAMLLELEELEEQLARMKGTHDDTRRV
jgi:hypothetical protein